MSVRQALPELLLWLFVINLGIAFGAGLYEARIALPQWLQHTPGLGYTWHPEAAREANTGVRFWVFVTTVPLTLLTLVNLVLAWRARPPRQRWWRIAALVALADRLFTFSYFIPTMVRLMGDPPLPPDEAASRAVQWMTLNHLRHAIVLTAWLAALRTLSLPAAAHLPDAGRPASDPQENPQSS